MEPISVKPFPFCTSPPIRRHGPKGYIQYQNYKEWLRDEYIFRCSYCLTREAWFGDLEDSFSIDHFKPQTTSPELTCIYENLFYCCRSCNCVKGAKLGLRSPDEIGYGSHLILSQNGEIKGSTIQGKIIVDLLKLNTPKRIGLRFRVLKIAAAALRLPAITDQAVRDGIMAGLDWAFGFPENLPDLSKLLPPDGNSKPEGINTSHFNRRGKGDLPAYY